MIALGCDHGGLNIKNAVIKYLEERANNLEDYVKNELTEKNRSNKSIWISIGVAFFTAGLSFIMNLL